MSKIEEGIFVKPIKDGSPLKCPICLGIVDNPQRLPCSHVFCLSCVTSLLPSGPGASGGVCCPMDRKSFQKEQIEPERYLREIIDELDVTCVSKECKWTGEYQTLASHLQNNCEYQEIDCSNNCGVRIMRKDRLEHANTCSLLKVLCPSCGVWNGFLPQLEDHVQACKNEVVMCPLSIYGCTYKSRREELNQHISESLTTHFTFVVMQLEKSLTREKALQDKLAQLTLSDNNTSTNSTNNNNNTSINGTPRGPTLTINTVAAISQLVTTILGANKPVPIDSIKAAINVAIYGQGAIKGGAHVYDAGNHQLCVDIYVAVAELIVQLPNTNGTKFHNLLRKGLDKALSEGGRLGTRNDAAWILRDAFEHVKKLSNNH